MPMLLLKDMIAYYKCYQEEYAEAIKQARLDGMKEAVEVVKKDKLNIKGASEFSGGCLTTCNLIIEAIEAAMEVDNGQTEAE